MAQPGNFTPILLYGSSTPTNVPLATNLTNSATGSEIAINVADKNLFFKDSGGTVNTVPIRQSSTSSNGWLSNTDWNTFNGKAPATSGTSILYGNGTGGFSNVTIGSGISFAGGTLSATGTGGTVTSVAALTLGTTGTDLSSTVANGTTTPVITLNVPTASAANRGALSAADWSTFNSKQAALVSGTNIKTVGGVTLLGSGDVGTIGVGYGGTGLTTLTAGYIPYGNGTSAFGSSGSLNWDSSNLVFSALGTANFGVTNAAGGGGTNKWVKIQGNGVSYGAGNAGNYGGILLSANANYTADARQFLITNALGVYNFGIIRSVNATTAPSLGTGGAVASGTVDFMISYTGGVSIGNTNDPGATNLSVTGGILVNTTAFAYTDNKSRVQGGTIFTQKPVNVTTSATLVVSGVAGMFVIRDNNVGGTALVLLDAVTGVTIVSQQGAIFTTVAPLATQIQLGITSSPNYGMTALAGATRNGDQLNIGAVICQ